MCFSRFTLNHDVHTKGFLTTEEALFGWDHAPSMASSSKYVGPFFNRLKKDIVDFGEKKVSLELLNRVEEYWELSKKEKVFPVAEQFTKDELLDKDKVEAEMCRLINGHDLAYNIFLRRLTGRVVDWCNTHPAQCCAAVGINPHSIDWTYLTERVCRYGKDCLLFGDLSKEEIVTALPMWESFVKWLTHVMNLDDEDTRQLENGLAGLHSYYFIHDAHLYYQMRGHSSGHFLTTLYNSFCVWWMHKYTYMELVPDAHAPGNTFEEAVPIVVHGDDSFGGVREDKRGAFNMVTISQFLKEKFCIKYTCADDKNAEVKPFGPLTQATFLGRGFVWDNRRGCYLAPLRMVAIVDMMIYSAKVGGISESDVYKLRVENAFKELYFWGPEVYDKIRKGFIKSMEGRKHPVSAPRYKELKTVLTRNWYHNDYPTTSITSQPWSERALD